MSGQPGGEQAPVIVIKKKKGGHGGHHGGAWKVAYADFVTAMMALFIVLWLMNANEQVKQAVGGYFRDPTGHGKETGTTKSNNGDALKLNRSDMTHIKEKIENAMKQMPELEQIKKHVDMTVTGEGLRIELLENEKGVFFESGSPKPTGFGQETLEVLAKEIGKLPNRVLIEGHTDSRPFVSRAGYSNWELSADRANSARQIMQATGLRADQVSQVRGFADQRLRKPDHPEEASNRRISLTIQYTDPPPPKPGEKTAESTAKETPPPAKPSAIGPAAH